MRNQSLFTGIVKPHKDLRHLHVPLLANRLDRASLFDDRIYMFADRVLIFEWGDLSHIKRAAYHQIWVTRA
jgi:hypothetical protein